MNRLLKFLETISTVLLTTVFLLWRWILNTALITMVVGLAVFLATQNIESYGLADYQELMRGYALLASIATAVMFILNKAISFAFTRSAGFSVEMLSTKDLCTFEENANKESLHYSGNSRPVAARS